MIYILSASAVSILRSCPMKFRLMYLDHLCLIDKKVGDAAYLGTEIHNVIQSSSIPETASEKAVAVGIYGKRRFPELTKVKHAEKFSATVAKEGKNNTLVYQGYIDLVDEQDEIYEIKTSDIQEARKWLTFESQQRLKPQGYIYNILEGPVNYRCLYSLGTRKSLKKGEDRETAILRHQKFLDGVPSPAHAFRVERTAKETDKFTEDLLREILYRENYNCWTQNDGACFSNYGDCDFCELCHHENKEPYHEYKGYTGIHEVMPERIEKVLK